jgi:hypothetical protein
MRGPSGVDDILKAFEAERAAAQDVSVAEQHSTVFTPSGPPPTPPRDGRYGVGTPADPLSEFMNMSDTQSVVSESTLNPEKRRGRRRNVITPVGATLDLNV